MKYKTTTGYKWAGVNILMTANHLHRYFQKETHLQPYYYSVLEQKKCEDLERHRHAFLNRMEFQELTTSYEGKTKFPYDEFDLALYLHSLYTHPPI